MQGSGGPAKLRRRTEPQRREGSRVEFFYRHSPQTAEVRDHIKATAATKHFRFPLYLAVVHLQVIDAVAYWAFGY